ncbi:MAG: MoaD/ThiS family protein [Candidatus Hodarchaeota archaeon]
MEVFSILINTVNQRFKNGDNTVIFGNKITLAEMLKRVSIPEDMEKIVLVNGKYCDSNYELKDGDIVKIFPPIAGG